jgi:hypothetical protein
MLVAQASETAMEPLVVEPLVLPQTRQLPEEEVKFTLPNLQITMLTAPTVIENMLSPRFFKNDAAIPGMVRSTNPKEDTTWLMFGFDVQRMSYPESDMMEFEMGPERAQKAMELRQVLGVAPRVPTIQWQVATSAFCNFLRAIETNKLVYSPMMAHAWQIGLRVEPHQERSCTNISTTPLRPRKLKTSPTPPGAPKTHTFATESHHFGPQPVKPSPPKTKTCTSSAPKAKNFAIHILPVHRAPHRRRRR